MCPRHLCTVSRDIARWSWGEPNPRPMSAVRGGRQPEAQVGRLQALTVLAGSRPPMTPVLWQRVAAPCQPTRRLRAPGSATAGRLATRRAAREPPSTWTHNRRRSFNRAPRTWAVPVPHAGVDADVLRAPAYRAESSSSVCFVTLTPTAEHTPAGGEVDDVAQGEVRRMARGPPRAARAHAVGPTGSTSRSMSSSGATVLRSALSAPARVGDSQGPAPRSPVRGLVVCVRDRCCPRPARALAAAPASPKR